MLLFCSCYISLAKSYFLRRRTILGGGGGGRCWEVAGLFNVVSWNSYMIFVKGGMMAQGRVEEANFKLFQESN